jgi:quercetin dioxygenase-like cupin family protein
MRRALPFFLATAAIASPLRAQDPTKVDPKHYKTVAENERVRVLKVTVGAKEKTPMHEHPDNFVVFLTDAKVRFTLGDGTTTPETPSRAGDALVDKAGKHSGENLGGALQAIVVEVKPRAKAAAAVEGAVPPAGGGNVTRTTIVSGPHGEVVRLTTPAGFEEPAGSKHDYDAVVIPMTEAGVTLDMDGKPVVMKKGEAYLIPRAAPHGVKSKVAADTVVVYVK